MTSNVQSNSLMAQNTMNSNSGGGEQGASKLSQSRISGNNKRSSSNLQGAGNHDLAATGFLPLREEDEPLNEQQFQ